MVVSATLTYTVTRFGPTKIASLNTAVAAVVLPTSQFAEIGATLNNDTTSTTGADTIDRVIVFNLDAKYNALFPAGADQKAPFRNLFTTALSSALKTVIAAAEPVLA